MKWKRALIGEAASIREAIEALEAAALKIVLVVDEHTRLLGTITDGDIRRGILRGVGLDAPASAVMNRLPTVARNFEDPQSVLAIMKLKHLAQIPIVDELGCVVGIERLEELVSVREQDSWVMLMVGGLGSRLAPLTEDCPKPMLNVGGKPLLETILEGFIEQGFRKFYLAVNYKAEMVEAHFGNGARWGAEIRYLREEAQLGTAGALRLLPELPTRPLIVMNGDLLTKVSFRSLLDFHFEQRAEATMCIREYHFQVPYGVVRTDGHRLLSIDEKPVQNFFVSAGIYVLSPELLRDLPAGEALQMPGLFEAWIARGHRASAFPVREYWLDIGQMDDFNRANGEFKRVFE